MDLFTVYVNCYDSHEVCCGETLYKQILFDGIVKGEYFTGKVLKGGVDTQVIDRDFKGTLSARYMLEGVDSEGKQCRIFVDNSAAAGEQVTRPVCHTDSKALAPLFTQGLTGRMVSDEEGFKIIISTE